VDDRDLSGHGRLRAFLKALKYSRRLVLSEALQHLVPEQTERIMGWFSQPYFDEGKAEGLAEGEAKVLVRLIEKRFGAISPQLRQLIFAADVATVEEWVERIFDAPDLPSVFGSN
jgi:hypothetical protein